MALTIDKTIEKLQFLKDHNNISGDTELRMGMLGNPTFEADGVYYDKMDNEVVVH